MYPGALGVSKVMAMTDVSTLNLGCLYETTQSAKAKDMKTEHMMNDVVGMKKE